MRRFRVRVRVPAPALRAAAAAAAAGLIAIVAACDSTAPRGPGVIEIWATTTSAEPNMFFEYQITVDSGAPYRIQSGLSQRLFVRGLAHGDHVVSLGGLPANCGAGTEGLLRVVNLRGDDTAGVAFNIGCTRTTGDVNVSVTTTGADIDPDGYLLTMGSFIVAYTPSNGTISLPQLTPGVYTFGLLDVADNCTFQSPQPVTVSTGTVSAVNITVTCAPLAYLRIVGATTGEDPDVDGLLVSFGTDIRRRVDPGETTIVAMQAGTFQYTISDVQPNCTLSTATTGTLTLVAGDTVTMEAQATCTALPAGSAGTSQDDPVADTLPNLSGNSRPAHDIRTTSTRYAPGWLIMTFRFGGTVVHASESAVNSLFGYLELDVDENPATGEIPLSNVFGANAQIGVDVAVLLFGPETSTVPVFTTFNVIDGEIGLVPVKFDGDSVTVYLPLEKLNGDDGMLEAVMAYGTLDRPTDVAPNDGAFLARPADGTIIAAAGAGAQPRPRAMGRPLPYPRGASGWPVPRRD